MYIYWLVRANKIVLVLQISEFAYPVSLRQRTRGRVNQLNASIASFLLSLGLRTYIFYAVQIHAKEQLASLDSYKRIHSLIHSPLFLPQEPTIHPYVSRVDEYQY